MSAANPGPTKRRNQASRGRGSVFRPSTGHYVAFASGTHESFGPSRLVLLNCLPEVRELTLDPPLERGFSSEADRGSLLFAACRVARSNQE